MHDLTLALARILRPIVRVLIARDMLFPAASDALKHAYLEAAEKDFSLDGKPLTDSRVHLLTGLQRRDIKSLRKSGSDLSPSAGPVARVTGLWRAEFGSAPLSRTGPPPSFEALVNKVSKDVHPRTILDELVRLGLVTIEEDLLHLSGPANVPSRDDRAMLDYFAANVGDHAMAAADNMAAAPDPGPHFERAVHYNRLSAASVAELDGLARKLFGDALATLNARAAKLQHRDGGDGSQRVRMGAYIWQGKETE